MPNKPQAKQHSIIKIKQIIYTESRADVLYNIMNHGVQILKQNCVIKPCVKK